MRGVQLKVRVCPETKFRDQLPLFWGGWGGSIGSLLYHSWNVWGSLVDFPHKKRRKEGVIRTNLSLVFK